MVCLSLLFTPCSHVFLGVLSHSLVHDPIELRLRQDIVHQAVEHLMLVVSEGGRFTADLLHECCDGFLSSNAIWVPPPVLTKEISPDHTTRPMCEVNLVRQLVCK